MGPALRIPSLLERARSLADRPGVYLFKDARGKAIYIGKALSLRKRVAGHFRSAGEIFSKEGRMLAQARSIEAIETPTEADALLLEASLVKESLPKYNKELKDDKSYPFLKVTAEEYPRLLIVRGRKPDGSKYFGPYTNVRLLRQAVRKLRVLFPMRICETMPRKVCLMYHIGQCGGPCEQKEGKEHYRATVRELLFFLEGRREVLVRTLLRQMREYSSRCEYEKAQAVYEEIRALSQVPIKGFSKKTGPDILKALQGALSLPRLPRRMEAFDISNIFGKEAVGSMVVFEDGEPARSEYRRFRIKTVSGIDDFAMMCEVVRRRYTRVLAEKRDLPDLVVIDGGKGHLTAAQSVLLELGLADLPVISIAKQHEHLFSPEREGPYIFPQSSPILQLVQRLRDEAHRFAIRYHRKLHKREGFSSLLDRIPGVGPKTREKLLLSVGSVSRIRLLSEADLADKAGVSEKTARRIVEALGG